MSGQRALISRAFQAFMTEAPDAAGVWSEMVQGLAKASALDEKTRELAYLAVLAALELESGIPFHVKAAKGLGASREEIISALLVGLPAAGHRVAQVLPVALDTFDEDA